PAEMPRMLPDLGAIEAAAEAVYAVMPPTPQYRWPQICARLSAEVWLKHENHTRGIRIGPHFALRGGVRTGRTVGRVHGVAVHRLRGSPANRAPAEMPVSEPALRATGTATQRNVAG